MDLDETRSQIHCRKSRCEAVQVLPISNDNSRCYMFSIVRQFKNPGSAMVIPMQSTKRQAGIIRCQNQTQLTSQCVGSCCWSLAALVHWLFLSQIVYAEKQTEALGVGLVQSLLFFIVCRATTCSIRFQSLTARY